MKLDKIAFAKVVAHCISNGMSAGEYEVEELDRLIDIPVPEQPPAYVSDSHVNLLLAAMNQPGKKIEAIKAYRSLTGAGLREAKDAVERYWKEPLAIQQFGEPKPQEAATLGDILDQAMKK